MVTWCGHVVWSRGVCFTCQSQTLNALKRIRDDVDATIGRVRLWLPFTVQAGRLENVNNFRFRLWLHRQQVRDKCWRV